MSLSIVTRPPLRLAGPAAAPSTPPPIHVPPLPPDVDFTTIDTPQKAALLPNLNASAFTLNQNQLLAAVQDNFNLAATLHMTVGQATPVALKYAFDYKTMSMDVQGTAGDAAVHETWAVHPDQGNIAITGTIGNSQENLVYSQQDDGWHLDGTVGSVDVHETLTIPDSTHFNFDGNIGNAATHQVLTIQQPSDPKAPTNMHVDGTVGTGSITTDEAVTNTSNLAIELAGKGSVLGTPEQIDQSFVWSQVPAKS